MNRSKLRFWDSVALTVGIIVGVGIFETAPAVNALCPTPLHAAALWLVGGLLSYQGVICYAELARRFPSDAGEYVYLQNAYGSAIGRAFLFAQALVVRPGSLAALAFPFAHYGGAALGIPQTKSSQPALAVFAILFSLLFQIRGFHSARLLQNFLTLCKAGSILLILLIAWRAPACPAQPIPPIQTIQSAGLALILILFTFGGWNEIVNLAGRLENSNAIVKRASAVSLVVVAGVYVIVSFVSMKLICSTSPGDSGSAIARAAFAVNPPLSRLLSLAIALSSLGAAHGLISTGAPFYALLYRKTSSDETVSAVILQALMAVAVIIFAGSFSKTIVYTSSIVWLFFMLIGTSFFIFRRRDPVGVRHTVGSAFGAAAFTVLSLYLLIESIRYSPLGSLVSIGIVALAFAVDKAARIRTVQKAS